MKKSNTPSKWSSTDTSRTAPAGVSASDAVDKTGAKITNLPPRNTKAGSSNSAPVDDDKRDSKR